MKIFDLYYSKKLDLQRIIKDICSILRVEIHDKGILNLPSYAYNKIRKQYNAILLAAFIKPYSIWLVDKDIYVPDMNFVFGIAMNKKVIVSFYRIPYEIISKEIIHELGHVFGLSHCRNECVMQFSNSLNEAIKKPIEFCNECKRKIKEMKEI